MFSETENITVAVRLRPMLELELSHRYWPRWEVENNQINEINGKKSFQFQKVFDANFNTEEIYEDIGEQAVVQCIQGFNGCIMCYGQTGSGKTFTMYGNKDSPGIVPLSVQSIFVYVQDTPEEEFLIRCSYLEVYNESVNDLLNKSGQNLVIQEDKKNGMTILGLTEEFCTSLDEIYSLLYIGESNKQFAATNLNMKSSRSHCIFRISIESRKRDDSGEVSFGTLYLVDLAGSESANVHNTKEAVRTMEMKHINRSLLTLGNIITKLSERNKNTMIPYRESKLTRILRNSLEGNSKIVMICNITASNFVYEETLSTLKFAMRAKNITQNIKKNEIVDDKFLLNKYQNEIKQLQARLKEMENLLNTKKPEKTVKKQLDTVTGETLEIEPKIEEAIQEKIEIENELQRLKAKIVVSENVSFSSKVDFGIGIGAVNSQERRRSRVSMIRGSMIFKDRIKSQMFDLKDVRDRGNYDGRGLDLTQSSAYVEKIQSPVKIISREELIIEKIENSIKNANKPIVPYFFSVLISADEIIEEGVETEKTKIEEYENYIKTLVNQITRKDQEIEKLKDELELCKGNFNRLQKLLSHK